MTTSKKIIDRKARNRLIAAIESFLAEKSTAFEFDESIFAIHGETNDDTVKALVVHLWHFYDDCTDHHVNVDRHAWGYMQRVLLLLHSDYHLQHEHRRIWLPTQIVAAVILAILVCGVIRSGLGLSLLPGLAFYGLIALAIAYRRSDMMAGRYAPYALVLQPFGSFAELAEVRRRHPKFQKQRYAPEIGQRRIRGPVSEAIMWIPTLIGCVIFSPLLLLVQIFPATHHTTCVVPG